LVKIHLRLAGKVALDNFLLDLEGILLLGRLFHNTQLAMKQEPMKQSTEWINPNINMMSCSPVTKTLSRKRIPILPAAEPTTNYVHAYN
jgi:hypothetical protein